VIQPTFKRKEQVNSDMELQRNILMEFMLHLNLKSAHIRVAVQGGIVVLGGNAETYADKIIARHLTQQFPGIKSIEEKREVAIPYFLK
jgi:osmotically-inducible protein OsmY